MMLPFTHLTRNFTCNPLHISPGTLHDVTLFTSVTLYTSHQKHNMMYPLHISPGTLHDATLYTSHQELYMMLNFTHLTRNFT